ncbi:FOG: PPR repeat [Plasmopara halstedii]|uniref:FOG: PPR repeat n=1 Tax=Plasmopara halstedii TaxID=4781 RepID=A0A0P1AER0_PLAHL|nr:FOG: PPR repeat [Plasmopara halstedii]CEG39013.1 FOG: PPR repeat [Plasmopara halstedii]|eukprot:XP_024575382.1 FOG: PPR repeat [Plasmopara halstedii]
MHPFVRPTQRLLCRVAVRATHWHSHPPLWTASCTLSTQSARTSTTHMDGAEHNGGAHWTADVETHHQSRKSTNSGNSFNLLSAHPLLDERQVSADDVAIRKRQVATKNRHSRKKRNNCRADMDRVSFRALLTESMRNNRTSAQLRKHMDEFPMMDINWSDQELVMIVCALIRINRSEMALELLRSQIEERHFAAINLENRDRVNRVAAASARMGNVTVALGVLEIAKHLKLQPDVITYTSAIHACARGGRSDPNARTYGAMILAYARLERWDEILNLLNSIPYKDDAHKKEVFTCAIISCSRNRQHYYASRLFELLLVDGVYPGDNVCNAVLSSCARISDLTLLHRIFKLVENHANPSIYSYNCMISAYGNVCNMEKALEVFQNMQKDVNVSPDIVTFNSLLLAAVRSRKVNMFSFILSQMAEVGIEWDAYTLNTLLEGCSLNGDVDLAKQFWSFATQRKQIGSDVSSMVKHNVNVDRGHYETMMAVLHAAKQHKAIVDLWQRDKLCRRRAKSSKALNFLICACKGLQDDKTATAIVAEFVARGHPLSSISHHHMLEVYLAADDFNAASAHFNEMMKSDGLVSTFSFTALVKYLAGKGHHSNVLKIFDMYSEACDFPSKRQNPLLHYPADAIYMLAMRSAVHSEDHEAVLAIYGRLPAITSMAVRAEVLKLAVSSCEREGDWRTAVTMYDEVTGMLDEGTNVELYKHVVKIVASAGEYDRALDVGGGQWYRVNRPDQRWEHEKSSELV